MDEETLTVEVDTGEYQKSIDEIVDALGAIQETAMRVGKEICSALVQLQKEMKSTGNSINSMAGTLKNITREFEKFAKWLEATKAAEQWEQNIIDAVNIVLGVIGTILAVVGILLTAEVSAVTIGIVAIIMAVVAAITAAAVEIVKYWDQISLAFTTFFTETLPQLWGQFAQWVSGVATAVGEIFQTIVTAVSGFFSSCWSVLEVAFTSIGQWIQENVINPIIVSFTSLAQWFAALFGSIRQTVSDVFYNIGVIVAGCWEILQAVWGVVAQWFRSNVTEPVGQFFSGLWESVSAWAFGAWEKIKDVFATVGQWFSEYVIQPVANFFTSLWEKVKTAAAQAWDGIKSVFSNVAGFFGDVFSDAWAKVVAVFSIAGDIFVNIRDGILTAFKKIVNGIISGINTVVRVPFNGINNALSKLRGTSILGISPFAGLGYISVPQIPYLAQGAVLPANKPFLAVVGDQRHGTNVEAPLATIQQAVGLVLEDQIGAMMAGFQALLQEQRATRQAVESIRVGDETIAAAVDRHRHRTAMMRGI